MGGVREVWSNGEVSSIFESSSKLVVDTVLDSDQSWNSDWIFAVKYCEELLIITVSLIKKAWVLLDFRWSLNFHTTAFLKHLAAHLIDRLLAVFLQLLEGSDNIILQLKDELLGRVTKRIDIVQIC